MLEVSVSFIIGMFGVMSCAVMCGFLDQFDIIYSYSSLNKPSSLKTVAFTLSPSDTRSHFFDKLA